MVANLKDLDMFGQLDTGIRKHSVDQKFQKCPFCGDLRDIITIAHFTHEHGLSIELAKEAKKHVETVQPFQKRGAEYIRCRKK